VHRQRRRADVASFIRHDEEAVGAAGITRRTSLRVGKRREHCRSPVERRTAWICKYVHRNGMGGSVAGKRQRRIEAAEDGSRSMRDRFPGSLLDGNGRHLADQRQRGSNGEQETLTGTEIATRETSWGEPRLIVMPGSAAAAEAVTAATRTTT